MVKTTQDSSGQHETESLTYGNTGETTNEMLFSEENNIYAYQEPDDEVDLFVNPVHSSTGKWKHQLRSLKNLRFWLAIVGWVGMKTCILYFWILLPTLSSRTTKNTYIDASLYTIAGFGTLFTNLASYKVLKLTIHDRRIYFGLTAWFSAVILIGM